MRGLLLAAALAISGANSAEAGYWNVFNIEGENSISAGIVTYATFSDMLADTNRTGVFEPNTAGFGRNVVGGGSDGTTYWNVFNIEGENSISAGIVTYATLADMLADTNRTGVFEPNTAGFGRNVVGSGSDGTTYWNVFNIEGESSISAGIVTYATLADMLADTNRTGVFEPNTAGFGRNVVGSGSDGTTYWNVFNIEGESSISAGIVTYATLSDMLADVNRTGVFEPNTVGFGRNVVGSGAVISAEVTIPEPLSLSLFASGILTLTLLRWGRRTVSASS
ncbi:hypothetical protein DFH01_23045 [Falsiroseomonas bella]|uniref:PEP-CTERM protein-sorting domain-containing protein n=1 Tax=Falsiroseomonas bella TaxID=2184016 RepID=A0A317F8U3_9PROT|nr:hypothetical protein DFH01_23045 [Falsiroseomonas bella]